MKKADLICTSMVGILLVGSFFTFSSFLKENSDTKDSGQVKELPDTSLLKHHYGIAANTPSDINEHIPVLKDLAQQCRSVTEIGVRWVASTWGILRGLAESPYKEKKYLGIDLVSPPPHTLNLLKELSQKEGIDFNFLEANDMTIELEPCDMLFIDSMHTYCHLTYELEKFSPKVNKYICMHDTSAPWGFVDDTEYHGDYSEYPAEYSRSRKGLWPAVQDFLERHPEWMLKERKLNNHGFTILERKSNTK